MIFAFYTLGCKVNQYETQAMEQELLRRGHTVVSFERTADCYIVNTCSVTAVSDKKSRAVIRQARRRNPNAVLGVCGCYAQTHPDDMRALEIDVLSGTGDRMGFLDAMERAAMERGAPLELLDDALRRRAFEPLPAGGLEGRTRAMLKVQDGCSNFCTYCIIPYARGPVRSLGLEAAVAELHRVAEAGYREAVVTGIEISSWGKDLRSGQTLVDLLAALCEAEPGMRIRLGSLEPRTIDARFCEQLARYRNLCPQFHLSLQSGCDATLARMNRRYDTARYLHSVELLKAAFPGCAVTTDLITGFPGEDETEFSQTLDFIRRCGFAAMHIFPYSRRGGTKADAMPNHVPPAVKDARAARAAAVAAEMTAAYRAGMVGTVQEVLFEQPKDGGYFGHARNYVPVLVQGEHLNNQIRPVRITAVGDDGVIGELN